MWRKLLNDRMKLAAHYEACEEATCDLVFARADHRLGPQLRPSTCTPAQSDTDDGPTALRLLGGPNRITIAPTTIVALARVLQGEAGRLIVDKTGLGELRRRPAVQPKSSRCYTEPGSNTRQRRRLLHRASGSTGVETRVYVIASGSSGHRSHRAAYGELILNAIGAAHSAAECTEPGRDLSPVNGNRCRGVPGELTSRGDRLALACRAG
jgi:hypothetical protein